MTTHARINFTGGELSPRLDGRFDVSKHPAGCRTLENFTVVPQGGARKRSGSRFVIELPSNSQYVRLIPFQYSTEQSYMLAFGPSYIWFCKDQGIITHTAKNITGITAANPAVVTSASHGFSNGDKVYITSVAGMTEVNNRWFTVANQTTNTFELSGVDSSAYTAYSSGGTAGEIVEVTTTYTEAQIDDIQITQINDVMYIVHPAHPLRKLSRTSDTSWTLSTPDITTGPFRTVNADTSLTMTPSSFSGSVTAFGTHIVGETFTLTAGAAYFTSDMVGSLFRLWEEGGGTGIPGAALGDSTKSLGNGDSYTYQGNVYGVSNLTTATTWEKFNRVPEHTSGIVRVIGSVTGGGTYFDSNFLHPGYCVVKVTAYTSSTVVTCEIVRYQMPASIVSGNTTYWEEGAWSAERGYPTAITLYEQRLFLAGSTSDPTVIWGSRSGAYEDFEDGAEDDDAIIYRLSSGLADVIRWMFGRRILTAGTSQGEYAISASSQQEALTPSNVKAVLQTDIGTSNVQPVAFNQAVLYPQRRGDPDNASRKLREYTYSFTDDAFNSVDLTIFSEHIFGDGLTRIAYQREPDSTIWVLRSDGDLAACTYERPQEIVSWHRHSLGGTSAAVKDIAVKPAADGDEVWMVVQRTVNSATVRYIEVLLPAFEVTSDKTDAVFVDCGLTYDSSATSSISGLWHLRGESVSYLGDGAVYTGTVSSVGKLTLDAELSTVHIGYPYTAILETENIETPLKTGPAHSRPQRIASIFMRVLASLGGSAKIVGGRELGTNTLQDLEIRRVTDNMDGSPALYTGLVELDMKGGYDRDIRVRIEHDEPLPFYLGALVAEIETTER